MTTRDEGGSGDYGYDLAHEETTDRKRREAAPAQPPDEPKHAGGRTDVQGDLAYDEAHDF